MKIQVIENMIDVDTLKQLAQENYGDMIKGVVDLEKRCIALGGELHADAESVLLQSGSKQKNLWGFNVYVEKPLAERLEFTSFINIRPRDNNRDIEIQDQVIRQQVENIVNQLIAHDKF